MFVEPGILDANVLAYASNADDPHHTASRTLIEAARDPSITLYVTPQILCEFYSVITNPRRVAAPSSPAGALQVLSALLALPDVSILPTTPRAVTALLDLLRRRAVTGPEIFDLQIVATMKANDIPTIYTFNAGDFEVFPELTVIVPGAGLTP
jgi:predicted nucleic acid-binding protein